ncbi:MAG TPA: DUF3293 domain-containing protein [Castellaniella sp.]|uniref:DUF3293 domain-containing protein n=1 Tax=Castellaniella sp. TaxID=1955812 RepID=UPI002F0896DF
MPRPVRGIAGSTLEQAYRQAIYRIDGHPPRDLVLDGFKPVPGATTGSNAEGIFITACNPRSRRLRPSVNARRLRALQRAVQWMGYTCLAARALDPQGLWPEEPSFWVPRLPLARGHELARRFGQNAFVACDARGVARLMWVVRRPVP